MMRHSFRHLLYTVGTLMIVVSRTNGQDLTPESVITRSEGNDPTQSSIFAKTFALEDQKYEKGCGKFKNISKVSLSKNEVEEVVAIELYSSLCVTKFLIILDGRGGGWTYSGTIPLGERYTEPAYKAIPLFIGQRPAIVVTNNTVDSGAGISQQNMQVFSFIGDRLRLVFNEPERVHLAVPFKPTCCPVQYTDEQRSTFNIIDPAIGAHRPRIEETRRIQVNGRSLTEYRAYSWDDCWNHFYSVAFAPSP